MMLVFWVKTETVVNYLHFIRMVVFSISFYLEFLLLVILLCLVVIFVLYLLNVIVSLTLSLYKVF